MNRHEPSRVVILCESYSSIAYVLYRLEKEDSNTPVSIFFTVLEDLYKLFQVINQRVYDNELDLIFYPNYAQRWVNKRGIARWLYFLSDVVRERRHIRGFYKQHLAGLKSADIFFPSPGYSGAKIYFLNKLSRNNRLIFIDPGPPYMGKLSPRSIREIGTLFLYQAVYGRHVQIGQFPAENPWSKGFPLMSERQMKKTVTSSIDWADRDRIMESLNWEKFNIFDTSNFRIIYFHQDWVGRYVPDKETFKRELDSVFSVILRHYPENQIARKYHPGHNSNKDVVEAGEELPIYIPAEFLYNDKVDFYVGITSTAITNVRGGQAISIINLISLNDEEIRERFIERLVKSSRTEILIPSSLEDLDKIVSSRNSKVA